MLAGYPQRGSDVRSYVRQHGEAYLGADDHLPYAILSYANGEGYDQHNILGEDGNITRFDLRDANMTEFKFKAPSPVPKGSESHSGADVGIFASGILISTFSYILMSVINF